MSRIVPLSGTRAERAAASQSITEGLFCFMSISSVRFYTKKTKYADAAESDVITIDGKSRVFDALPDEPRDEIGGSRYWSSDYIVVLDKPDTELYHITKNVKTYPAEAGMAHGMTALMKTFAAFFVTLAIAFALKQGSWSFLWAGLAAAAIIAWYWYEYRARVFYAGLLGKWYVYNAIRVGHGTREHYVELVRHLAGCDDQVVADVNTQILRWL